MTFPIDSSRRRFCQAGSLAALGSVLPAVAQANADRFPSKPLKIVVPFPAGGLTDALARQIGNLAHAELGQPFIVDNRPGVSGNIGAELVAKSPADGHTMLLTLSLNLPSSASFTASCAMTRAMTSSASARWPCSTAPGWCTRRCRSRTRVS